VNKSTSPHVLIMRLADTFGISSKGNAAEITARIATFLVGRDTLVIIDQADDLADSALEWLRQIIYDEGRTGLVLAGVPKLASQIMNVRNDHDQLLSRIGMYLRLPPVEPEDVLNVVRSIWPELPAEVEQAFVKHSTMVERTTRYLSMRRLNIIMKRIHRVLYRNGIAQPTVDIVEHAAHYAINKDM
jgi:DNA transposition AAA+ family ATPase